MPANRITTSSVSRRRLARSSSLSIGGRSRAARRIRPELWAAPAISFCIGVFVLFIHDRRGERIEVKSAVIGEHPQVIIAPPDHPLAKQRSISPREIAKQTILMREVGSGTRLLEERFLAQHGIEPRIGMEIGSNGGPRDCVYLCTQQLRLRLATAGWLFSTSPACQRSGSGSWCIQRQNE
jgi:DNA-binding transcriptional LysR family regulator